MKIFELNIKEEKKKTTNKEKMHEYKSQKQKVLPKYNLKPIKPHTQNHSFHFQPPFQIHT